MTDRTPASAPAHPAIILSIILLSYFMILLDNSVIFTALPSLQQELELSVGALAWVQDAYTMVFGGLLLLGARAGDLFGRRRVFVFGLVVFSLASLLIGLAPTDWWIIAARALQGVGAAIVAPSALSLLTASFAEGPARTRAVAWYGATAGIGASLGLVIGGALAHSISWRAGFFVNVPIGLAMILLAPRFLPETKPGPGRFDLGGALAATLGVGALVFGIINTTEAGWGSPVTIGALLLGAVLLVVLVVIESRASQPIMPLPLFRDRERTGAYLARFFYLAAMIGFFYFTTQYLQEVLGMNPLEAGLAFLPMTLVNFAVAMAIPRILNRVPGGLTIGAGALLTLLGMLWLSRIQPDSDYLRAVALPMLLIGAGQGLAFAPLTSSGVVRTTAADAGAASGIVNTVHQLGMALGLGVLVAISAPGAEHPETPAAISEQVGTALTGGSVLLLFALIATAALIIPAQRGHRTRTRSATPADTDTDTTHGKREAP